MMSATTEKLSRFFAAAPAIVTHRDARVSE
jgi:hypothetical protein